ncbi:LPXTG cell wall anchor domain-containing protein [Enterococcus faecalis]|uniref:SpaA isopeptide-forming pilin-related protein n=1 Tax=Enterococcus faecalis TaxID=1351 RepID=UPI00115BA4B8|nr:SpaA isopeptide-forming pilin-related protein [Enterococcus faecalis]EGO5063903.1 LPXTG cell wall anchor domain-containing protein [Enterococcus faecalis]EGO6081227.1 LPXTG cell wall anchor domain-containing protein [Enterococcus faecalis]EHB4976650.1 LPXTG cell wall anchor domain-containing protein [Enterococcus faecalis]EHB5005850.1 LPXTG cell wall anchor domain-containing protein [Enterococcus faecalis]EHE8490700.1 LPXTG cell wall anchor domain-containing protein [Enterococcus faecalis]
MKFSRKIKNLAMIGVIGLQTLFTAVPVNAVTALDVSFDHNNEREMSVTWKGETRDIWTAPIYLDQGTGKELVFCVDPFSHVLEGTGYSSNPFALNRKANLISSLWNLAGTDLDTMFVAQEMLYNEVGAVVHSNGDLTEEQRMTIKKKINDVIANYEKQPSFHNSKVKLTLGESTVLTDTNGSNLSQFDVVAQNTANVDFRQSGNKLTITPKSTANSSGTLILKKSLREGTPFIWKKSGSQELISSGVSDPSKYKIDFEIVTTGEMKIVKLDKETGKPVPNTKFEVEYNGKKQTVTTDTKGEAIVKNIPHNAKVKATEIFVPAPYVLDKNNTKEVVVKAGKTASVEFKNEVATGKTTLIKEDKTTNSDKPLNPTYPMVGAKYGLFKENSTLLKEFTLDEKLTASMDKLDLGTYYWQETEAPAGYTLDPEKHVVELTYKDQNTPVVIKDSESIDDVIRMNLDGQKVIQNETNEIFKNGVEFTATNERTQEKTVVTTANVDGKNGYFKFGNLPIDDYIITETKGVEGYQSIDPIEVKHSYDKESDTFTFTVTDQKSGNVLNTEQFTQKDLSKGENVDLGTYTLKDKATPIDTPWVDIVSIAHTGDGKTRSFIWGKEVKLYDDVKISHKNIPLGTKRAFEDILVAVTPDNQEKDVWSSGKIDYKVANENMTQRVETNYDYKKDPEGTRYFFKVIGYSKVSDTEYKQDTEHNFDGNQKNQEIIPALPDKPEINISSQAHIGDNKTQIFIWGEKVKLYDNVKISHKNVDVNTERAFETILVAVTPDGKEKDAWTSGKVDYKVTKKDTVQTVQADYDYKKDLKGTRYYFKEIGYNKTKNNKYEKDSEHNIGGKEKTQDIIPTIKEEPKNEPKKPERGLLPYTGEKGNTLLVGLGFVILGSMYVFIQYKKRKKTEK